MRFAERYSRRTHIAIRSIAVIGQTLDVDYSPCFQRYGHPGESRPIECRQPCVVDEPSLLVSASKSDRLAIKYHLVSRLYRRTNRSTEIGFMRTWYVEHILQRRILIFKHFFFFLLGSILYGFELLNNRSESYIKQTMFNFHCKLNDGTAKSDLFHTDRLARSTATGFKLLQFILPAKSSLKI